MKSPSASIDSAADNNTSPIPKPRRRAFSQPTDDSNASATPSTRSASATSDNPALPVTDGSSSPIATRRLPASICRPPAAWDSPQLRPAEHFALEEAPLLLPVPTSVCDVPIYAKPKVHRDHHIEVAKALYSIPGDLIGAHVDVRADRALVRVSYRGAVVKVHPRQPPGGRSTDPADLPADKTVYAMRDLDHLRRLAAGHGPAIGVYAAAILEHPLPWTKMRQVYALLGLVKRWGPERVEAACTRAAQAEAFNVGLIARMIERATEADASAHVPAPTTAGPARFARDPSHFATAKPKPHTGSSPTEQRTQVADGGAA